MPQSLANTRRALASSGGRLNSFGEPFTGNTIRGVQRRTYMGSGLDEHYQNQVRDGTAKTALGANSLTRRPAQATGTKAVEQEVARRESAGMESAAQRGAPQPSAQTKLEAVAAAPTRLEARKSRQTGLARQRRLRGMPTFEGRSKEEFFKQGTKPSTYADLNRVA